MDGEVKKLRRIPQKGWLGGVCAGVAYYFGFPVWATRLIWCVATLWMGFGFLLYVLLWIFMPIIGTPDDYSQRTGE